MSTEKTPSEPKRFLDTPRNVDRVYYALLAVCLLLIPVDLLYQKHAHFDFEAWFGFYGFFGFAVFVFVVVVGGQLRKILMRDEDYYDR